MQIYFSFQDDYIKNMEENMGSDESKSDFIWLKKIFLWAHEDSCVVSFEV